MKTKKLTDEQILDKLLNADVELPSKEVFVKRLEIPLLIQGISETEIEKIQRKNTFKDKLNIEDFNLDYIVACIKKPDFNNERLLKKYSVSSAKEVLKRMFLPGELAQIKLIADELNGFEDSVEEIKN
jgi:hypothetical protein